jgi:hypothetical protein
MNVTAECRNRACSQYRKEKSVVAGQLTGYSAGNDHMKCPSCGETMVTVSTMATSKARRKPSRASHSRPKRRNGRRSSRS